ncbi:ABC transporter ATP-binding protein [Clostridium estertheticum]|uniref:ABC transporter ATP-binding protein n=1 Tax=Clostridium estertheticum TaxID=238834 RepID=UPI00124D8DBC|nr:ABC transporter ATP-binding protein [Clostridium estertheticum]MBZ9618261.1 ABC transporter ATP-binding protein [Clostridium estertheticum subsp. laramiense]WAG76237.1 ABC transporter ATP-binding protein [Clostridium estertheticum]
MLIATNLSKEFILKEGNGLFRKKTIKNKQAVNDVSIKIEPGKIVGLLGINGAGKTTTIKMLAGLIEPTCGTIFIDDIDVIKENKKIKKFINLISGGERNIYWRLTAQENLEYFGALYGVEKKVLNERIKAVLETVALTESKDIPVERYSKGMKQRLQIARGLINNPQYIFLDEPTLGLDINIAKELRTYVKKLATVEKKGVLLTTHYIAEAEELCDYLYIIDKGYIIAQGTLSELKENLATKIQILITVDRLTESIKNEIDALFTNELIEILYDEEDNKKTIRMIAQKNYTCDIIKCLSSFDILVLEMKLEEPNLEEVLLKVLAGGV